MEGMFPEEVVAANHVLSDIIGILIEKTEDPRKFAKQIEKTEEELTDAGLYPLLLSVRKEINPGLIAKWEESGGNDEEGDREYEKLRSMVAETFRVTPQQIHDLAVSQCNAMFPPREEAQDSE